MQLPAGVAELVDAPDLGLRVWGLHDVSLRFNERAMYEGESPFFDGSSASSSVA